MLFLGETRMPEGVLPGPDTRAWWERGRDYRSQFAELTAASHRQQMLVDNSRGEENALMEAYDKRIAAVAEASGVELQNPLRQPGYVKPDVPMRLLGVKRGEIAYNRKLEGDFADGLKKLAAERPELAAVIRADVPVGDDAALLAQGAMGAANKARSNAPDVPPEMQFAAEMLGSGSAMFRDPLGAVAMLAGGPETTLVKSVGGRILVRAAGEAVVNGGSEAVMQLMAQDWRQKAGVEDPGFWQNVGLAAAFGGGFGGAVEGASAAFRALGRDTPEVKAALARMSEGAGKAEDVTMLAEAAGVKLAPDEMQALAHAAEADADTAVSHAAADAAGIEARQVDDAVTAIERDMPVDEPVVDVPAPRGDVAPVSRIPPSPEGANMNMAKPLLEDADYLDYVRNLQEEKELALEAFVRENEADLKHLDDGGSVRDLPSGRAFDTIRAADDADLTRKVRTEIARKLDRDVKAIKAQGNIRADDPAVQLRYAEAIRPREVLSPAARAAKLGEPGPQALDAARGTLAALKGEAAPAPKAAGNQAAPPQKQGKNAETGASKPGQGNQPKATPAAPKTSLDAIDGLVSGMDGEGKPIVVTFTEMKSWAERMDEMADLVAACKVN